MNARDDIGHDITPDAALREIDRVSGSVRRSTRWAGRWLLVLGLGTIVYWLVMLLGPGSLAVVAAWAWIAFTIAGCVYVFRKNVYDRLTWRLQWPVTGAYVLAVVLTVLFANVMPEREPLPAGWVLAAVLAAVLCGTPPLYGAWRLLRAGGEER
ncbi:hypothetical protein HNP84_003524 [Thermocatellispora tengchongensis]|uniref:Uncharacterized protein n=1 Tax=Thermocatellispora tengchongensis TaxID=1073253 RepID=A0A840P286_9ACTN|nr:hypothetical protein [Thermocatellispora tengchongensis]MBB5133798.1 hypothetical protein [Thermocatellispora tengchongensis]